MPARVLALTVWLAAAVGLEGAFGALGTGEARAGAADYRLRCRQEYPSAEGGHPQGLLVRDLDGDGKPELVGLTYTPGTLQVSGGYRPSPRALPAIQVLELGDWAVGPAWLDATGKDPATARLLAVAPRKPSELLVVDAGLVRQGKGAQAVRWRTPLERRARFLATGDLGKDGRCEVLVTTVESSKWVLSGMALRHQPEGGNSVG